MRRIVSFPCAGETLVGTIDEGGATTGLLIVSGGNEIRMGAHRGMALLAGRLTKRNIPVFRYDRRGVGDSTGENTGFEHAAEDIVAAATAFRAGAPHLERIVAFGNCDAATALGLFHMQAGVDRLVLANPWTIEPSDDLPPAAAIRARYAERLKDPRTYLRLLRGGVNIGKLLKGLSKMLAPKSEGPAGLARRLGTALAEAHKPVEIVLAKGDATAIAFADTAIGRGLTTHVLDTASHSFARGEDQAALDAILLAALDQNAPSSPRT